MNSTRLLQWTGSFLGAGLIVAAVRGLNPLEEFRAAMTGTTPARRSTRSTGSTGSTGSSAATALDTPSGPIQVGDGSSGPYTGTASNVPVASMDKNGHPVPVLVSVYGRHKLAPVAAVAFEAWKAAYGGELILTGAWRPIPASGTRATSRSADASIVPSIYAGHTSGEAVDLSLGAMGVDPYKDRGDPRREKWETLFAAATATGWQNWTLTSAGRPRTDLPAGQKVEFWHFSVNGRH